MRPDGTVPGPVTTRDRLAEQARQQEAARMTADDDAFIRRLAAGRL